MKTLKADDLIAHSLIEANLDLATQMGGDVIFCRSGMTIGVDDEIRIYMEEICENKQLPCAKLCVLIETNGGFIETVERIYTVFRHHYQHVEFIVPSYAYSAGTVLVMSGDEIYMDYYSILGPIDPQVGNSEGEFVPGMGYLHKFQELVEAVNADATGTSTRAELAYLLKKFDPARLFFVEQAKEHSKELLKQWLPLHKFRNWTKTEGSGKVVDEAYKQQRANQIAEILGEPKRWHSHGRGIGIRELEHEEINLRIKNFGDDPVLNKKIRSYYNLAIDYFGKLGMESALHGSAGYRRLG